MGDLWSVSFAEPTWLHGLWFLPAIAVLYVWRRRSTRHLVPHLPLWERVLAEFPRRRRWARMLLSILIQMLVLALALTLLARPYVEASAEGQGHTILVLDQSLGTRALGTSGASVSDGVVSRAREVLQGQRGTGTVALATLSDEVLVRVPSAETPDPSIASLANLSPPRGRRDAASLARLSRQQEAGTRVIFVTPFEPAPSDRRELAEAGVLLVGAERARPQAGIVSVTQEGPRHLRALVRGAPKPRELHLVAEGRTLVQSKVTPGAEGTPVVLEIPKGAGADFTLQLHPEDGFPNDDAVELHVPEREALRVLVVSNGQTPYLDAFLEACSFVALAASGRTDGAHFRDLVPNYDVVILVDLLEELPLPSGTYLLLGAGAPELPIVRGHGPPRPAQPERVTVGDPLVRGLDLTDWIVHEATPTRAEGALDVIVLGSLGPLVSRGQTAGIRFVDVAVGPGLKASTLPQTEDFPLLLEGALLELAGNPRRLGPLVHAAGGAFDLDPGEEPRLRSAGDQEIDLVALADGTGWRLPETPGRYRVAGNAERTITIALLDHPGVPGMPLGEEDSMAPFPREPRREPLDGPVLAALLALLLLEWLTYAFLVTD